MSLFESVGLTQTADELQVERGFPGGLDWFVSRTEEGVPTEER